MKRIAVFAFPAFQMLDAVGPLEVFSRASRLLTESEAPRSAAYKVELIGIKRGPFAASSGITLHADRGFEEVGRGLDTLLIAGGRGLAKYQKHPGLLRWIRAQAKSVRRLGSVCTGAFLLAEAGLLDGRRVTTHWGSCTKLSENYPRVSVEPDRIFVQDGPLYTSAGVTAGMDLALALVEEDLGREVALATARALVMFLRRPGGQAQFSAQLSVQFAERKPLSDLQTYILENPHRDLSVETLARRSGMSPRNFARVFRREVGVTPAQFVTRVRVETARRLLEESVSDVNEVCARSGLGTTESMRRAFLRALGIPPSEYRERFHSDADAYSGSPPSARSPAAGFSRPRPDTAR